MLPKYLRSPLVPIVTKDGREFSVRQNLGRWWPRYTQDVAHIDERPAAALRVPPELFEYICDAANSDSWPCRLVCRYWNKLCTPRVLERTNAKKSPEQLREIWRFSRGPQASGWHMKAIYRVPIYDEKAKFPWIHLLTQIRVEAGWSVKNRTRDSSTLWTAPIKNIIHINGPFSSGNQTFRSVHLTLPRSLPPSLSRGIRTVYLLDIKFRRFEDLTHLACELPDLETLACFGASFGSVTTQLPHRRPRANRNKLTTFVVRLRTTSEDVPRAYGFAMLTLYLSVYDPASFFSEDEVAVILALLPLMQIDDQALQYDHHEYCTKRLGESVCQLPSGLYRPYVLH